MFTALQREHYGLGAAASARCAPEALRRAGQPPASRRPDPSGARAVHTRGPAERPAHRPAPHANARAPDSSTAARASARALRVRRWHQSVHDMQRLIINVIYL